MNAADGAILAGFPWFQADSNFTTPALGDVYGNGRTDIVEGGDSSAGSAYGTTYTNGGHLRVLSPTGNAGTGNPGGGLVCQYNTDQTVQSSPAVGEFGGSVGIVFGTGATFTGATTTNDLIEVDSHCSPRWIDKLDGTTTSSPALADILGNGQLDVLEGTRVGSGGSIWALNGITGATIWQEATAGQVIGSVVTADLTGGGYQDAIVPTTAGVRDLRREVRRVGRHFGPERRPGLPKLAAGHRRPQRHHRDHHRGLQLEQPGSHPALRGQRVARVHGQRDRGVAHVPPRPAADRERRLAVPVVQVPCNAPAGGPVGYDMTASDGGVFNYGNLPFCGSTGNLLLTKPVVGMALTHDGGGYWLVASDGGVFAFGDAAFHGSAGNLPLTKPVVGMAVTPDGGGTGWWRRTAGCSPTATPPSTARPGNLRLTKPVVGMAVTPDGGGYWLVASDGGIFAYGDAAFHGSAGNLRLTKPVVGMAADSQTGGYWLVASDGGIFSYGAPFLGSAGNLATHQAGGRDDGHQERGRLSTGGGRRRDLHLRRRPVLRFRRRARADPTRRRGSRLLTAHRRPASWRSRTAPRKAA